MQWCKRGHALDIPRSKGEDQETERRVIKLNAKQKVDH